MEPRFGMQPGAGREKKEIPVDGPARVVKPGDWGAVPDAGMKGFQMAAFSMPGRAGPKPTESELKIAELTRAARKAEDAHKQAMRMAVREGEDAALSALAKGREEGLREGESLAWEKYLKALEAMQGNASMALEALSREKASLFLEFEGQVLELFSASIHRVFEGLANEHADAVLPLLKKAVTALGEAATLTLKVNPSDCKTVQDNRDFWLPVHGGIKDIRVVSDERIPKGGCYVVSDSTSVGLQADQLADRIDEELKRVYAAKAQALRGAGSAGPGDARAPEADPHDPGLDAGGVIP